jgi:hypothetical protein
VKNKIAMLGLSVIMATSMVTPVFASVATSTGEYQDISKNNFVIDVTELGT